MNLYMEATQVPRLIWISSKHQNNPNCIPYNNLEHWYLNRSGLPDIFANEAGHLLVPGLEPFVRVLVLSNNSSRDGFRDPTSLVRSQTIVVFDQHFPTTRAHEPIWRVFPVFCKRPHLCHINKKRI
ncbi:hypothetical protein Hanom_Chr12g01127251 [Helianthus anomalus]